MNIWHDIAPSRVKPEDFWAVIEIEKGSKNKYELDKETGMLRLAPHPLYLHALPRELRLHPPHVGRGR